MPRPPPGAVRPLRLGRRVLAYILDSTVVVALWILAYTTILKSIIDDENRARISDPHGSIYAVSAASSSATPVVLFAILFVVTSYYIWVTGRTGQTPGKRLLGLWVVDSKSGAPIGIRRSLGRYFVQGILNFACYAGLWSPLLDSSSGRFQGLHDKAVGSQVISIR